VATGTYAPDPDLHVVDANGIIVPGGLVWTYIAGTTTPATTYTDVGLTVPNPNPIVAGSDGRFVAFLAGGISYKFAYEMPAVPPAHGTGLTTRDNILAVTTITPGSAGGVTQITALTGTINDLALIPGCAMLIWRSAAAPATFTGFSGGVDGQRLTVVNESLYALSLPHLSSSSLAANRLLNFATSAPTNLAAGPSYAGGSATYLYDGSFARWNLVAHEQGAWISPTFNAADYGATGGTWSIASGNVVRLAYRLSGRTLQIAFQFNGTTVAGTPTVLTIGASQWGGYTPTDASAVALPYSSDVAAPIFVNSNGGILKLQKLNGSAFAAGTVNFLGQWMGEVA